MEPALEREFQLEELSSLADDLLKKAERFPNICLYGELGAGKTTLVKEIARSIGISSSEVTSPTYTYMHSYTAHSTEKGPFHIYHFDLYRLNSCEDFEAMGWMDYFQTDHGNGSKAITLIEWPSRVEPLLPSPRLEVKIDYISESARKVRVYERV